MEIRKAAQYDIKIFDVKGYENKTAQEMFMQDYASPKNILELILNQNRALTPSIGSFQVIDRSDLRHDDIISCYASRQQRQSMICRP